MTFLNNKNYFLFSVLCGCVVLFGCRQKTRVLSSPPHYNFAEVYTDKLDLKLQEISGLTWDPNLNLFYAVNDEQGKLFTLDKESKVISGEFGFGDNGDYEDVAILNDIPYILRSDGTVFKFMRDNEGKSYSINMGKLPLAGSNDFESMYSYPEKNALILICKNCKIDDNNSVSAFAFYPDSIGFDDKPFFVIDAKKVRELSPFKTSKFQPSAAAIHPQLNQLVILSSASNQLVMADLKGNVQSVYKLSPALFPQPEGLAFKNNGNMYISNEGINKKATLLSFRYINTDDSARDDIEKTGYNLTKPDEIMELGRHLREISGMSYLTATHQILAENDEKGDIFTVDFAKKNDHVGKVKFGGKGDYEDILYKDSTVYMLISNGVIVSVDMRDSSLATQSYTLDIGNKNEFETMYLNSDGKSLVLLCKDCHHEKNEVRKAYRFDLATKQFSTTPIYQINISSIQQILNDDKAEFKPSAGAISPVNGKLYLVASVGKILVVANVKGEVENVVRLNPQLYNQPEGITFAPNGDLYISNEGGEGIATILKFKYMK
ncbi:MAG: SdiA-regulated domain-containing protein [Chitinophagaceae bacterium]|nr:SdiA-regulated domain-containing protein [Chitinophagaceae bacterium]